MGTICERVTLISAYVKLPHNVAIWTITVSLTTGVGLYRNWWAHWDLNPEPKDYAYHFDFCRRISGVKSVRGLDHAFTMPLPV